MLTISTDCADLFRSIGLIDEKNVVATAVARYSRNSMTPLLTRIWNAIKHIFGQSDWQLAVKELKNSIIELSSKDSDAEKILSLFIRVNNGAFFTHRSDQEILSLLPGLNEAFKAAQGRDQERQEKLQEERDRKSLINEQSMYQQRAADWREAQKPTASPSAQALAEERKQLDLLTRAQAYDQIQEAQSRIRELEYEVAFENAEARRQFVEFARSNFDYENAQPARLSVLQQPRHP